MGLIPEPTEEIGRALAENDAVTEASLRDRLPNALWTE